MPPILGTYVPTLANRASEMRGLEYLPALSKDKMHPLFLLAPWPNAHKLTKAVERIEQAYPSRKYFLDIDRDYNPTDPDNPAQANWMELKNSAGNYGAWLEFCAKYKNVRPCLQLAGQSKNDIVTQIETIQEMGRDFCLRLELNRLPVNLGAAVEALYEVGTSDYAIVIEGGWVQDPLTMAAQVQGIIATQLEPLDGRIPIVVSCTSMRKGFVDVEGTDAYAFTNRQLLEQIRRGTNRDTIIYGDWGSTKPREKGFGRPLPRIDYPTNNSWISARNKDADWGFEESAEAILKSDSWEGNLGIWGELMIEQTASDTDVGIDSAQKNVAARVNIHLHRQALYGDDIGGIDLDEDWVDF